MSDYSKTLIYKIQNIDDETLLYVGSTVAFRARKSAHKSATNKESHINYKFKVYEMIRANGGWDAFNMVIIKHFPCDNKQASLTEEDRIMREMKATMNTRTAYNSYEETLAYRKAHYEENKDTIKAKSKTYREKNKDKRNEKRRAKYQADKLSKV